MKVDDGQANNDKHASVDAQEKLELPIVAPLKGQMIPLSEVKDPVFNSGAMGKGFAIVPAEGVVTSPVTGQIVMTTPTKHAIGLKSDEGTEVLIHIGLDTVQLNGQHFELLVSDGQEVKVGQPLIRFDQQAIEAAGYSTVTPVIITNSDAYSDILIHSTQQINHGDIAVTAVK